MKKEYEIRQEIRNYIREHPNKSKEEIFKDLEKIVKRRGFAPEIIGEEYSDLHLHTKPSKNLPM